MALNTRVLSRIKDVGRLVNVRNNQLIGYGLVVGLAGTGDGSDQATLQGISSMLNNFGVNIDASNLNGKNVAAVIVTAKLRPFNVPGDQLDLTVSSIGKAKSLRGGVLLLTPLKGANGFVYAVAQGAVSVGGYSVSGKGASKMKNHVTVGSIPNGAIVERGISTKLVVDDSLIWVLDEEDFTTVKNSCQAVRDRFPDLKVEPLSASKFQIYLTDKYKNEVIALISEVENIKIVTDKVAKIIINEKTGSIVMGGPVKIAPVVVSHANLSVTIESNDKVVQPGAFAKRGKTVTLEGSIINVDQGSAMGNDSFKIFRSQDNTIDNLVQILNRTGIDGADVIAILQLMKQAGAIKAKLEVI